jgi:AcrR family transcriptional regulator
MSIAIGIVDFAKTYMYVCSSRDELKAMTDSQIRANGSIPAVQRQKRGILTRQQLIRSARAIFARDGFEHARLEDIALNAGKTRGAFYANFKDKEDVFFAIFEENIDRDVAELTPLLARLTTAAQRVDALGEYLAELSKDRQRTLLNLEFKLYAIRHPRKRKRFASLRELMRFRCAVSGLSQILPLFDGRTEKAQAVTLAALGGIVEGLALNHLFDPAALDDSQVLQCIKQCLRTTFQEEKYAFPEMAIKG